MALGQDMLGFLPIVFTDPEGAGATPCQCKAHLLRLLKLATGFGTDNVGSDSSLLYWLRAIKGKREIGIRKPVDLRLIYRLYPRAKVVPSSTARVASLQLAPLSLGS